MIIYTRPRWGAMLLGALCTVGAGAILLDDIRTTGQWTTDHLLAVIEGCRMDLEQTRYLDYKYGEGLEAGETPG